MNIYEARATKLKIQWSVLGQEPRGKLIERSGPELNSDAVDFFKSVKQNDNRGRDIDERIGFIEYEPTPNSKQVMSMTYSGDEENGEVSVTQSGPGGYISEVKEFSPTHITETWCAAVSHGESLTVTEIDRANPENSTYREWFIAR